MRFDDKIMELSKTIYETSIIVHNSKQKKMNQYRKKLYMIK